MPRYDITPELSSIVKSTRVSHNVAAKSVAEHIGKSQAFVSKLENGGLKSIDRDQLIDIFEFILGSEAAFQEFLNETLFPIFSSLTLRHKKSEIEGQLWYTNFDTVLREIPIPESLIKSINQILADKSIPLSTLCDRINGNEMIDKKVYDVDSLPSNIWLCDSENGEIKSIIIKLSVNESLIKDILFNGKKSINYITMFAIVFYMFLIEEYGDNSELSNELYQSNWKKSTDFLNQFQFYSLEQKRYLESKAQTEAELKALISEFDENNRETINEILQFFKLFSEYDMLKTTERLSQFKENLTWDGGFMLRLISLDFTTLEDSTIDQRKSILSEITEIIQKNKSESSNTPNVEFYD